MFAVIYKFKVKLGQEEVFTEAWTKLTQLIYQYEASLGSRLHRQSDAIYIAYAQWPDRNTWAGSGEKLPKEAEQYRNQMRESCESIETLHELEMVENLLKNRPF